MDETFLWWFQIKYLANFMFCTLVPLTSSSFPPSHWPLGHRTQLRYTLECCESTSFANLYYLLLFYVIWSCHKFWKLSLVSTDITSENICYCSKFDVLKIYVICIDFIKYEYCQYTNLFRDKRSCNMQLQSGYCSKQRTSNWNFVLFCAHDFRDSFMLHALRIVEQITILKIKAMMQNFH